MTSAPITTSDLAQRAQDDKLSLREKIGYGLGDAGGTVITCLIMNFLTFFYTDVFGLTPALVWLRLLPAEYRPRVNLNWSLHLYTASGRAVYQYVRGQ